MNIIPLQLTLSYAPEMDACEDCVNSQHSYDIIKLLILTVLSIYVALTRYIHLILLIPRHFTLFCFNYSCIIPPYYLTIL